MLYNKDFLFLHCPKTAGKSVAVWFCHNMDKPIHGIVSRGQIQEIGMGAQDGVHLEVGGSHDDFTSARKILQARGIDISSFKALLLPIRNPYDLVVSKYFFMRASHANNPSVQDHPYFQVAAQSSFADFCAAVPLGDITRFMPHEGDPGPPIELIPFERLGAALRALAIKYGITEQAPVPHLNKGQRPRDLDSLFDAHIKHIVDEKMDMWFKIGGYQKRF